MISGRTTPRSLPRHCLPYKHCIKTACHILFIAWALSILCGCAGSSFGPQKDLLVSDPPPASDTTGVRVTYLGTNGYLLESRNTVVLVDPYFTRIGMACVAL